MHTHKINLDPRTPQHRYTHTCIHTMELSLQKCNFVSVCVRACVGVCVHLVVCLHVCLCSVIVVTQCLLLIVGYAITPQMCLYAF